VGNDANGHFAPGRAGNTHFPPNATQDYDYNNPTLVESDIEDWTPGNTGDKKLVNNATWESIAYAWPYGVLPDQTDSYWYLYWMQNMPGRSNTIPYGNQFITNWWKFTGDWDTAVPVIPTQGGLHAVKRAGTGVLGDVNGNNRLGAADVNLALRIAVGLRVPSGAEQDAADVNGDRSVNLADVLFLLRRWVGL
jgi:hypothetical protein